MNKIGVITKNIGKIAAVKFSFDKHGIDYEFIDKEYVEIQAETSKEIAEFTVNQAVKDFKMPVIREDASLYINALGFPGPYTAYIEKMVPAKKLLSFLKNETDRGGYFESAYSLGMPGKNPFTVVVKTKIKIAKEERGDLRAIGTWDRVLMFENETRTFAEYPIDERVERWSKPYDKLAKYIKENLASI